MQTRIMQLEAMLAAAQDEIEERDKAIIELYQKYTESMKKADSEEDPSDSELESVSDNQPPVNRAETKRRQKRQSRRKGRRTSGNKAQNTD